MLSASYNKGTVLHYRIKDDKEQEEVDTTFTKIICDSPELELVRQTLQKAINDKLDIWALFTLGLPEEKRHLASIKNPASVKLFLEYGGENKYCAEGCKAYFEGVVMLLSNDDIRIYNWLMGMFYRMDNENTLCNPMSFHAFQIFYLYYGSMVKGRHQFKPEDFEAALRAIWNTTTTPLLTRAEYESCFRPETNDYLSMVVDSWNWYYDILWDEPEASSDDPPKKPRCLKDLTRCFIRNILKQNHELPKAIDDLPIPELVKAFLRLEE